MLRKKSCKNCKEKIKGSPNFCSNCGIQLKDQTKNWGMLGKSDSPVKEAPNIFQGIGGNMMNKMLGSAIKMLEKEMQKEMKNTPKTKVKLMINGKEINTPIEQAQEKNDPNTKILPINFSKENLNKWKNLKKIEPKSNLKRVEDKIQYEIEVPEVESIKDISIVKLENSLEVRAIGQKKGYQKNIPINLPLKKYSLLKGLLTLEMDTE